MLMPNLALGDAYSVAFEYTSDTFVEQNNDFKQFYNHPKPSHKKPLGEYSDDTQMSIAIAELIVEGSDFSDLDIANKFVECYKRCPIKGYAGRFQKFLDDVKDGKEFLEKICPDSDKSGAAMRATPLGVIEDLEIMEDFAIRQAKITHNTPDGIAAALAVADASHYIRYNTGPVSEMNAYLNHRLAESGLKVSEYVDWEAGWNSSVGPKGWSAVRSALTEIRYVDFLECKSLDELVLSCVDCTGDVDTNTTIAVGIMSPIWRFSDEASAGMMKQVRPECHGYGYLVELSKRLENNERK